jgi:aspartate 1-decarboxylase
MKIASANAIGGSTSLRSLHRVAVTDCELHYEGSCTIDEDLLDAVNLAENEQVHIWNINNGECYVAYAIRGDRSTRKHRPHMMFDRKRTVPSKL